MLKRGCFLVIHDDIEYGHVMDKNVIGVFTDRKDAEDFMMHRVEGVKGNIRVTRYTQGGLRYRVKFVDMEDEYIFRIEESSLFEKISEK